MRGATEPGRGALGLALEILEQVARQREAASAADIARALGAPKASVYRVINSLVQDEFLLRRSDFAGFMLGARVVELAALVGLRGVSPAQLALEDVRRETSEAVHLFAFTPSGVTLSDEDERAPVSGAQNAMTDPTRSAAGHLWLAERFREGPPARGAFGRSVAQLEAIVSAVDARGYGEQAGQMSPDRACLAVPINAGDGRAVAALAMSVPLAEFAVAARHLPVLRATAERLSAEPLPTP